MNAYAPMPSTETGVSKTVRLTQFSNALCSIFLSELFAANSTEASEVQPLNAES